MEARKVYKEIYPATWSFIGELSTEGYYYGSPDNFNDEVVGTQNDDIALWDSATPEDGEIIIIEEWQDHKNVLRVQDDITGGEDPTAIHNISNSDSGTVEFWIGTNDVTQIWHFNLREAGEGWVIRCRITASKFQYQDSLDVYQDFGQVAANDTWYHVRLVWRADNTFDAYVNGLIKVDNQATNNNMVSGIDRFYLTCLGDSEEYVYFDGFGDGADSDYTLLDNHNPYGRPVDVSEFGSEYGQVGAGCSLAVIPEMDGHKNVLELYDYSPSNYSSATRDYNIVPQTSGTVEWWYRCNNTSKSSDFTIGGSSIIYVRFDGDKITYYEPGGFTDATGGGIADNTWYHCRVDFECGAGAYKGLAADTYAFYLNGVLLDTGIDFRGGDAAEITYVGVLTNGAEDDMIVYIDAIGYSWDTNYKIGDNIQWRHLTDPTFEDEDVGTENTDIDWVDSVNLFDGECIIIGQFDEHKKVLRFLDDVTGGEDPEVVHNFTQVTSGIREFWVKSENTAEKYHFGIYEDGRDWIVRMRLNGSQIQYRDAGDDWQVVQSAFNNVWYHIRLEWYADNTFDLWVDGIFKVDGGTCNNTQVGGADQFWLRGEGDTEVAHFYLDGYAELENDNYEVGENRTYDYRPQSYTDITTYLSTAEVFDESYLSSIGIISILLDQLIINNRHILQLLDSNSHLRFEGNFFKKTTSSGKDIFTCHSLNKSNMKKQVSYTASAEDPNDILLGILTDLTQAVGDDSRLIYYTVEDPAGSHSPTIINVPFIEVARRMAYHGNMYFVLKPHGSCFLDDGALPKNGAYTISESTGEIQGDPIIETFDSQINKVTVYGSLDPDTGVLFSGISQDTTAQGDGTGILEYSKHYPDLRSNTDCTNRAVAIRTGSGFNPQIINVKLLNVFANPGEIINFAYAPKSFSATNCYVRKVTHNLLSGISIYELSTGILEDWGMSMEQWSIATEGERQQTDGYYASDILTINLALGAGFGAFNVWNGVLMVAPNAPNHIAATSFYINSFVDSTRDIIIDFSWTEITGGACTVDGLLTIDKYPADGLSAPVSIELDLPHNITFGAANTVINTTYTLAAADIDVDATYFLHFENDDAGDDITLNNIQVTFYQKRTI